MARATALLSLLGVLLLGVLMGSCSGTATSTTTTAGDTVTDGIGLFSTYDNDLSG